MTCPRPDVGFAMCGLSLKAPSLVPALALLRRQDFPLGNLTPMTVQCPRRKCIATAITKLLLRMVALTRPPGALDHAVLNGRRWRAGEFPAVGLHATAASIARFYGDLLDHRGAVATLFAERAVASKSIRPSGLWSPSGRGRSRRSAISPTATPPSKPPGCRSS